MTEQINWADFASPYWSPERGEQYRVVLAYWRQETRSYDDGKTEKPVIVFDVLKVDGEEYAQGQRKFVTGAASFADEVKPIITAAAREGKDAIHVLLKYSNDKRYTVVDLSDEPIASKKVYMGLKE